MRRKISLNVGLANDVIFGHLFHCEFPRDGSAKVVFKTRVRVCFGRKDVPGPEACNLFVWLNHLVNRRGDGANFVHSPVMSIFVPEYAYYAVSSEQVSAKALDR